ncbi:MAG: type II toxin-antitoxin system PemK/MazF family toxin [Actinomycetota bacterium]
MLVLTRAEVIDVRELVTVAEITTTIRGIAAEVSLDHADAGLDLPSVVNCDGIHTIHQRMLTTRAGEIDETAMTRVCSAISYSLGC